MMVYPSPGRTYRTVCRAAAVIVFVTGLNTAIGASGSKVLSPQAAANYLDSRADWWMSWPPAARDGGTFCISCHTTLPYALARPAVHSALGETGPTAAERRVQDNVVERVRTWQQGKPYYDEKVDVGKGLQSRGTESVVNALILASADARTGKRSEDTRLAFHNMWSLQESTGEDAGAWPWLNFGNEPFEARDSVFYGAGLAAIAVGTSPESGYTDPTSQRGFLRLRSYLVQEYSAQSLINQAVLLWAAAKIPDLLSPEQRASIRNQLFSKQNTDGGWSLSSVGWTWSGQSLKSLIKLFAHSENPPLISKSDGYATGLIAFALEQEGATQEKTHLGRALAWLARSQDNGRWPGFSMNHRPESDPTELFMSDAATAYAVLALTYGSNPHKSVTATIGAQPRSAR